MNQQNNQHADHAMLAYAIFIAFMAWLAWYFLHQFIINAFGALRHGELWLIAKTVSPATVNSWQVVPWHDYLGHPRGNLTLKDISESSKITGHFLRLPATVILSIMGYFALFRGPGSGSKKTYSLDRLIRAQSRVWPVISPIVAFNPAESSGRDPDSHDPMPAELPLFAEALSPEEWLRFHRIAPYDSENHERSSDPLDREAAFQTFAEQLGPRWRDATSLPWHARCLFAVFALKAARKREEADALLGRLAMAANAKHGMALRLSPALKREVMRIIRDPKIGGAAEKIAGKHAFMAPALLGLLMHARQRGGVLAPAQFLWLRGADRGLWYPLNNLGRQSFHTEAAGAMAHFQAEIMAGTPLFSPKVETAIDTLDEHANRKNRMTPALVDQ